MTPVNRDALLASAQDLRAQQRVHDALAMLARLEAEHPRFSRLYQERGHCHIQLRDASAAIAALAQAVRLNPTLPASWDMLEQLYRMLGETAQAAIAAQNLAMLQQLPREVVMANCLHADGDLGPAEQVIRDYLARDPGNAGAARLLARICADRGAQAEAEVVLAGLLARAPDYHAARANYGMALLSQQKHWPARQQAEMLLAHDPDAREYLKLYASACIGLGDFEPVIDVTARLLAGAASGGEAAELRVWRANALKVTGRQAEAIAEYRAALVAQPDYGVAWFSLANLKTCRLGPDDISAMTAALARADLADMDRIYLNFALAKAHEDAGDHAAAWQGYARGNALRHAAVRYRPAAAEAAVERLKRAFTPAAFDARAGWGGDDPAPIFIVGLPRSGSTLIEQILASHSQVEGTQELTEIGRYAGDLCGLDAACGLPLRPEALLRLSARDIAALGARFIAETRVYRQLGRPRFIDKMPNNFWHIGLIHLIAPRSVIIDVRRDPMACGFSNFKQLFGTTTQEFSYSLDELARHTRAYHDLMRHWHRVLPGRVLTVHYEDVVNDLELGVRRMLDHCGLPFEPACLRFHETRRSIRTPSSEQVRQPITRAGLDEWQHYAEWLAPLRTMLGDAVARRD
ncbi:sulfotransferase [Novosphingobium sp.]|uniref:tetratricopeptide repeat-containing sulfotransferase family protein n=1 Tax=Novosphingobium sp. TaxID=1874826 RepID=UPI00334292BF